MPSNQIPEDVRAKAAEDLLAVSGGRESAKFLREEGMTPWKNALAGVSAIAPLIIEWARKDQAEVDATLAREWLAGMHRNSPAKAFPDALETAIRTQFTPETGGQ